MRVSATPSLAVPCASARPQRQDPSRHDQFGFLRLGGQRLVQPAELVPEQPPRGRRGHHAQPGLVTDRDDVGAGLPPRPDQLRGPGRQFVPGPAPRQPRRRSRRGPPPARCRSRRSAAPRGRSPAGRRGRWSRPCATRPAAAPGAPPPAPPSPDHLGKPGHWGGRHVRHVRLARQPQFGSLGFARPGPAEDEHPPGPVKTFKTFWSRTVPADRVAVPHQPHSPEAATSLEFPLRRHAVVRERHHRDRVRCDQPPGPEPAELSGIAQHVEKRDVIGRRVRRRHRHRPRSRRVQQPFPVRRRKLPPPSDPAHLIAARLAHLIAARLAHLIAARVARLPAAASPMPASPASRPAATLILTRPSTTMVDCFRVLPSAAWRRQEAHRQPAPASPRSLPNPRPGPASAKERRRTWRSGLSTLRSPADGLPGTEARRPPITGTVTYSGAPA